MGPVPPLIDQVFQLAEQHLTAYLGQMSPSLLSSSRFSPLSNPASLHYGNRGHMS